MYALTRALQHEVGLTALSDNFGTGTLSALTAIGNIGPSTSNANIANIYNIVVGGLYCKGYNGDNGNLDGTWTTTTTAAVTSLQSDIGVPTTGTVSPKVFKALLTMDAYILIGTGTGPVREVQRWMNATYIDKSWFYIIPADGSYSRDVQEALVYAIQDELGVAGANGNYGPGTRAAVAAQPNITVGSSDAAGHYWVRLFQAALRFNTYDASFTGTFTSADSSIVLSFQAFCLLTVNGQGDYETWSSLLVSNGDPTRNGRAADCASEVTAARASALVADGRVVVGRYLTNVEGSTLNKKIQTGELSVILGAGLRVFPIFQTLGDSLSYFSDAQGYSDAGDAVQAATGYGFKRGTTIYFAVDVDVLGDDIPGSIIPYFQGVNRAMQRFGNLYHVGAYGTRNVCRQLTDADLIQYSFVAGMSYGYSGNLGFTLPSNWAFDQISTITVGSGTGAIEIDNDIYSGRDTGQASVNALPSGEVLDVAFDMSQEASLASDMDAYCDTVTSNTIGLIHGSPTDVVGDVLQHDTLITNLSRAWGIRKALIQAVSFWEYWKTTALDPAADAVVESTYVYLEALEAWEANPIGVAPTPPVVMSQDSSTGFAQIFSATAIWAHNWALGQGLISGSTWDASDWHTVWAVWQDLHGDDDYNLSAVPQVLMAGAADVGITGSPRLDYTSAQITSILARYNGTGSAAADYGQEVRGVYNVFEQYNAALRG
ncbi:YbfG [Propionibacterium freudenreichii]|nr:glycoside hydrolase domain-containing protein [Propionibacterium freudenreichii]SPB30353.1 hypothetical protein MAJHIDBO_00651 [Propionibacterium freudenreichii subsp. shermanii]MCT2987013.1 DUF1906 domain-containing protein [Propionibacterium freudenreichii]CEI22863.1 peptidoglycan binding domain protein [Propionibacterium freudenreichii]SBN40056.1 YbfG [Propionibacterium freudenreichii]SBN49531.1 YbfG [Propionibacterium freudenreichii]